MEPVSRPGGPGLPAADGSGKMLSVVIPTLNEAAALPEALARLGAVCPGAELIVADGGSRDGTRAAAAVFPGVRWVSAPPGRAGQMNAGARAAGGDVLLFLHADTRLPSGAARAIAEALHDPRTAGGRFDVRLDSTRPLLRLVEAMMNVRSRWSGICTGDQAVFVRRSVFEAMGGYPDISLMEDVEFTRRLKRCGRVAALRLRVTTSARKWEREGILHTIALMWALRFLYWIGVSPARLHRLYYPDLPRDPTDCRIR
jgi:rSAM/selenodomain-associated transferase 2